jgi:hypothetical protein
MNATSPDSLRTALPMTVWGVNPRLRRVHQRQGRIHGRSPGKVPGRVVDGRLNDAFKAVNLPLEKNVVRRVNKPATGTAHPMKNDPLKD